MQTFVKVGTIQVVRQGEAVSHVGVMDALAVIGGAVEQGAQLYALIGTPEAKAEALLDAPREVEPVEPVAWRWMQAHKNEWEYGSELPVCVVGAWAPLYAEPPAPVVTITMGEKKTTLVLCLNEYTDAGLKGNPSLAVRALGIAWDEFVPCPMADRIILKGCVNVPEKLPCWLTVAKVQP